MFAHWVESKNWRKLIFLVYFLHGVTAKQVYVNCVYMRAVSKLLSYTGGIKVAKRIKWLYANHINFFFEFPVKINLKFVEFVDMTPILFSYLFSCLLVVFELPKILLPVCVLGQWWMYNIVLCHLLPCLVSCLWYFLLNLKIYGYTLRGCFQFHFTVSSLLLVSIGQCTNLPL